LFNGRTATEIDYIRSVEPMQEAAQNILLVLVTLFPIVDRWEAALSFWR
jgi:hypothetical protein